MSARPARAPRLPAAPARRLRAPDLPAGFTRAPESALAPAAAVAPTLARLPLRLLLTALGLVLAGCGPGAPAPATGGPPAYAATELRFASVVVGELPEVSARAPVPWDRMQPGGENALVRLTVGGEPRWSQLTTVGGALVGPAQVPALPAGATADEAARPARLVLDLCVARRRPGDPSEPRVALSVQSRGAPVGAAEVAVPADERWWTVELPLDPSPPAAAPVEVRVEPRLTAGADPATFYLAVAGAVVDRPLPEPAPVVVLVTSDTHRADHVGGPNLGGPNRGGVVHTPALDALAARGVVYEDCFAPSHVTLPSHAALFTGASPRDTGVLDNNTALGTAAPTLAEAFRAAGWLTGAAVSLDILVDGHSGFGQGFERLSAPERTRRADETVAVALDWLESSRGRPLFLWVHLADAHAPYDPPGGAVGYPDGRDPFDPAIALEGEAPHWLPAVRDVEYVRALYRGEVAYLDAQLGRLLEHPRARAGVVAVTADHGEVLGRHGIWWRHQDLYPDTLHVPLILAWPGAPAGTRVAEPVELVDLGRTLLDRAGLGGEPFPGRDLAAGGAPGPRFALSAGARSAAVDTEGWHLILRLERPHELELYDLASDPACELDRKQAEPARARALRATLVEWLDAGGPSWAGTRGQDPAVLARLAELGYTDVEVEAPATRGGFAPPEDCPCAPCQTWR